VDEDLIYVPFEPFQLTSSYEYYEFQYEIPENTSFVQLQVIMGQYLGSYFLDAFFYDIVDTSLSIDSEQIDNLILYPNPVDSVLKIKSKNDIDYINIFDNSGKLMIQISDIEELNLKGLSKGVYWINFIFKNKLSETKKIIVK